MASFSILRKYECSLTHSIITQCWVTVCFLGLSSKPSWREGKNSSGFQSPQVFRVKAHTEVFLGVLSSFTNFAETYLGVVWELGQSNASPGKAFQLLWERTAAPHICHISDFLKGGGWKTEKVHKSVEYTTLPKTHHLGGLPQTASRCFSCLPKFIPSQSR